MSKESSKDAVVRTDDVADEDNEDQFNTVDVDTFKTGLCEGVPLRLR